MEGQHADGRRPLQDCQNADTITPALYIHSTANSLRKSFMPNKECIRLFGVNKNTRAGNRNRQPQRALSHKVLSIHNKAYSN